MNSDCPCDGCTERFIACSDRCPKDKRGDFGYKAWKAKLAAKKKHDALQRNLDLTTSRRRAKWATIKGGY